MIKRRDWELRTQQHQMDAEGCQGDQMTPEEVMQAVAAEGFHAQDIDIHKDRLQGLWRFWCRIESMDPDQAATDISDIA